MTRNRILFSIAASLLISSISSASTFVVRSDRALVHSADAIVVASALTSYSVQNEFGGIETVTPVSISELIKGDVGGSTITVVEPGGVYNGKLTLVAGSPQFAEGRSMLLFLMKTGADRWSVLDLVIGKFTFANDRLGQKLLVRDEGDIEGYDGDLRPHREVRRSADHFLEFVRVEAHGRTGPADYVVPVAALSESTLAPARKLTATETSLQLVPLVAPFTANSYTMTISGSTGARWNVFPSAVSIFKGTTQEAGAPGGGVTAIQMAIASWDNECGSNINYVYSGADDGTHTQGLHGPDGRNTILYERDLSSFGAPPFTCSANGYSGTLGIGGVTSAGGNNTVGSETFVTTQEGDVEMNRGIANCTSLFNNGDFNSALTHETGHTLGLRHADQNRSSNGPCSGDPSLECAGSAIMTASITPGLNAALQTWDIHAVQAVYPGGSCTTGKVKSDFNADGKSDLVLQNSSTSGITTWLMNGTQPSAGEQIAAPLGWTPVATGDVDGDGHADVIVRNASTGQVGVYLMAASGLSAKGFNILASPAAYQVITTSDFNRDGTDDIVLQNTALGVVSVWLMRNGLISSGYQLAQTDPSWRVIASGDFDGDGWQDLILQSSSTAQVTIWRMQNGTIVQSQAINTPLATWHVIAAGDVDGNGRDDVILQNQSTGVVTVWMMNGFSILNGHVIGNPGTAWLVKGRGDFNGDHVSDVVIQNPATKSVVVWLMSAGSVATEGTPRVVMPVYNVMVNR